MNEHTDEKVNFFLVQIELWKIGESAPAPKFFIVSRPNDWTKTVRGSAHGQAEHTDTQLLQLEFWQQLRDFAAAKKPPLKLRTPRAQHWYDVAIGRSDCHVVFTLLTTESQIGCELYITNSKALFKALASNKDAIEKELGMIGALSWQELPGKKASRIRAFREFDFSSPDREDAFAWLVRTYWKFKGVFSRSWPNIEG